MNVNVPAGAVPEDTTGSPVWSDNQSNTCGQGLTCMLKARRFSGAFASPCVCRAAGPAEACPQATPGARPTNAQTSSSRDLMVAPPLPGRARPAGPVAPGQTRIVAQRCCHPYQTGGGETNDKCVRNC